MTHEPIYAIIDPRDNHAVEYVEGLDEARAYARQIETSPAHPYKPYRVRFKIRQVRS
jgi:hypothetical protein